MTRNRPSPNRACGARLLAILGVAALIAVGCSGETTGDETAADTGETTPTTETSQSTDTGPAAEDTAESGGTDGGDTWDDPRGAIFADFQAQFDRTHPFGGLERFCEPQDAASDRRDTDTGIAADTISVHHLRGELENLVDIGFGIDVGDPSLMFQTFVDVINEDCGGIRGRRLELSETSYDPLSPDVEQARVTACVTATEDDNAVVVMNTSGFQGVAALCVAEEHGTPLITNQGFSEAFLERGGGNLMTQRFSLDDSVRFMVERIAGTGTLDGKTIAVVGGDTPGQPEVVESSLVDALASVGQDPTVDIIGCNGLATCTDGLQESVGNLKSAGVDVVFPALNILSLPGYLAEMVAQGFAPGDVQFYNSEFEGQSSDLVSSKVAALGGEAAAALYDGTVIVDSAATGAFRLEGAEPTPFNQMCLDAYAERTGIAYDWRTEQDNTPAGMATNVCSVVRQAARAIYDAGDNPTRDDITAAFAGLGPVDVNDMLPATLGPGKYALPDANQTMTWTSPCAIEGAAFDENDTCIIPDENYELTTG
ncbi:MAG: ABC transporter substrate-binding protein [Acidimicrobiales bacterium]